jgi:hypothetical protein
MDNKLLMFSINCEHRNLGIPLVLQESSLVDQAHMEMGVP